MINNYLVYLLGVDTIPSPLPFSRLAPPLHNSGNIEKRLYIDCANFLKDCLLNRGPIGNYFYKFCFFLIFIIRHALVMCLLEVVSFNLSLSDVNK